MILEKFKPQRILVSIVVAASLGLAFVYYYRYQLKEKVLLQYQQLGRYSGQALKNVSAELTHHREKTDRFSKELAELNKIIAELEKDNLAFEEKFQVLKEENDTLSVKVAQLVEEKTRLEGNFYSLERLKKAIKIARKEKRLRDRIARIQRRLTEIRMQRSLDDVASRLGNRGYVVRSGYSTFRPRISVEIEPLGPSYSERE